MNRRPIVHQFTAVLSGRDAVGCHTMALDRLLREMGAEAAIYAAHVNPEFKDQARHFHHHVDDEAPDLIIYQASTGSPVVDYLMSRPEPIVINYHNMTPAEYYYPWRPHMGAELDHGRKQLAQLCPMASAGIADSKFNAAELWAFGLSRVDVAPVLMDDAVLPAGGVRSLSEVLERAGAGSGALGHESKATILFVGRLAPNKCQHDLLSALAILRRSVPNVELVLVGVSSADSYEASLIDYAKALRVDDAVRFVGSLPLSELVGWYQAADVFVCLSEHEGFCVPLVEAMAWGVPIVALNAAAVPGTLNGAGVLLSDKSPVSVAVAVERALSDQVLRSHLIRQGLARASELGPGAAQRELTQILARLLQQFRKG